MTLIIGDHKSSKNEPIAVRLVGVDYEMVKPKALLAAALAKEASNAGDPEDGDKMAQAVQMYRDWLELACVPNPSDVDAIIARLSDPADALEFTHVAELIKAMTQFDQGGAANPPT